MSLLKKSMLTAATACIGLSSGLFADDCCEYKDDCCVMDEVQVCAHIAPILGKVCDQQLEFATSSGGNVKHQLESEWEFGVRAGLDFFLPCDCWHLGMTYTYFNNCLDGSASTAAPHFAGGTATSMTAEVDRDYHVLDIALSYGDCNWCECLEIKPYSGLRYMHWDSTYEEINTGSSFTAGGERSFIDRDFDSVGFIWGLELDSCVCSLCDLDLSVRGRFGMGYHAADLSTTGRTLVNTVATNYSDCKCVSFGNYEGAIGVAADYCFCDTTLTLGFNYEFSHWGFNDDDDVYPSSTQVTLDSSTEVSFAGFSFMVGYCF